ncbi:unnamed protein product [Nezara viridula]|uniref:Neuropeptide n=1 Tax=Nezara viridula TaxID=85310 RepID=A0A9P0MTK8_NEZVI|nr:unnamed protein product [Nezara viridula]
MNRMRSLSVILVAVVLFVGLCQAAPHGVKNLASQEAGPRFANPQLRVLESDERNKREANEQVVGFGDLQSPVSFEGFGLIRPSLASSLSEIIKT